MILERKKLFFNTILMILEDAALPEAVKSGKYSYISAMSYKKMDLPGFDVITKTTALIGLDDVEDDIFKKFSDTTRNEIRKTYRNEDLKFIADDKNFEESFILYRSFEYAQGRVPVSTEDLRKTKFFGAYYKGALISGLYIIESSPYLRIRSIFSKRLGASDDKELYKIIGNSTRRLVWEVCLWGKKNNFTSLDLASVNFENPKTANITKFKMSFGGKVISEHTYIYKSDLFKFFEKFVFVKLFLYRLLNMARRSR